MFNSHWRPLGVVAAVLLAGGCASLPLETGRSNVEALVQSRAPSGPAAALPAQDVASTLSAWLSEPLTLERAQQIALLRNPALKAHYAQLGLSAAQVFEASQLPNPTLGLSWLLPLGAADGEKFGASLMGSFADLLLRGARQRIAAAQFTALQEQLAATALEVVADTQRAWYECVAASQRVAVQRTIEQAAQLSADLAQQYREAGNINALQLQLQRAEASQARIALHDARMQEADARAALQQMLGLAAAQSHWSVPQSLPDVSGDAVPADASLMARAVEQRLDISAARRRVQAASQQRDSTRRYRMLAQSGIGAQFDREADGAKHVGPALELALPLFQQGQGAIARADAELAAAEASLEQLGTAAQAELSRHWTRRELAREQVKAYREGLIPEREAVVARITEQANFMLVDSFAVLVARQQEYAAYAGFVDAQLRFWNAHVELLRALGSQRGLEETR